MPSVPGSRYLLLLLLCLLTVAECDLVVLGTVGDNVTLPCKYDVEVNGVVSVCWGLGELPYSKCNHPLVSTDGTEVYEGSAAAWPGSRYRLLGDLRNGDVSMTILNASESDSGIYGCRVEIWGWFNDHKIHVELRVQRDLTASTRYLDTYKPDLAFVQEEIDITAVVLLVCVVLVGFVALGGGAAYLVHRYVKCSKSTQIHHQHHHQHHHQQQQLDGQRPHGLLGVHHHTSTTTSTTTSNSSLTDSAPTASWASTNETPPPLHSGTVVQTEDSAPTLSLQINVPVLSLSLCLLLLVSGLLLLLAFKWEIRLRVRGSEDVKTRRRRTGPEGGSVKGAAGDTWTRPKMEAGSEEEETPEEEIEGEGHLLSQKEASGDLQWELLLGGARGGDAGFQNHKNLQLCFINNSDSDEEEGCNTRVSTGTGSVGSHPSGLKEEVTAALRALRDNLLAEEEKERGREQLASSGVVAKHKHLELSELHNCSPQQLRTLEASLQQDIYELSSELVSELLVRDQLRTKQDAMLLD
ncbi:hypothetical protein CRUP_000152, partial [Coryphaenoides rupestris]